MKGFFSTLILNIWFYSLFLVASAIIMPVLGIAMVVQVPFISHRNAMRRFHVMTKIYGRIVMALPYPFIKVEYQDCSDAAHTPCIYICNHRSASDPFLISLLPGEIMPVVNTWPFRLPVLGPLARLAGYLSINEMSVETFYKNAAKLLEEGASLVMFPEGTRSASRIMGQFHGAAFRLALQCGAPLVPVCLTGNENIPRKGSLKLVPGHIRVRRLDTLQSEEFLGMAPFKLKNRVRAIIAEETARMEAGS